jgi:hypothetical protein
MHKQIARKVEHFKGDLHLFNLKQKLRGKPVISEEEFEKLTGMKEEYRR